jgi:hypothetical protein
MTMSLICRGVVLGLMVVVFGAQAQTAAEDKANKSRPGATKSEPETARTAKVRPASTHKTAAAAATPAAYEALPPLAPELMAVSEQVHLGQMPCELGQNVVLTADEKSPGRFYMHHKHQTYHLAPVASLTGAIRLEDEKQGAVWIQLSNKSMLMNSKLGQRLADECQSPAQVAVAAAMKLAPPVNLLDAGRTVARQ